MILDPDLARKVALLVETEDETLNAYPPLEQFIIIALKQMAQNEKKITLCQRK
jgi:hypothetical protein